MQTFNGVYVQYMLFINGTQPFSHDHKLINKFMFTFKYVTRRSLMVNCPLVCVRWKNAFGLAVTLISDLSTSNVVKSSKFVEITTTGL